MKAHSLEIHLPLRSVGGSVKLDGEELQNVTAVRVNASVGGLTEVTVTMLAHVNLPACKDVEIETTTLMRPLP